MAVFILVHGSAHSARAWDLVKTELEHRRHAVVTPELPADEPDASASRYAQVVASAIPEGDESIVVAHSASGWFLPLVASFCPVRRIVFLAAAVPRIGMSFLEQFEAQPEMINPAWIGKDPRNEAVADDFLFHDCPPQRRAWAHAEIRVLNLRRVWTERYPLEQWPNVPASYIVCSEDRTIRPEWSREAARAQLGVEPIELVAGHCPYISQPEELAQILVNMLTF
ncbi:MAG: alpha/beta hydrolase [Candidatus Sulfotelmatobacter sp.]